MIQKQIEQFTSSLQNIATEYSDPSVILQHMPVLKDFPLLQQNPEYLGYGVAGLFGLLILRKLLKKRKKSEATSIAIVMPKPYVGEPEPETAKLDAPSEVEKPALRLRNEPRAEPQTIVEPAPRPRAEPTTRSLAEQLQDVNAISFSARTAMTPDEARMRVLVQAVLNEFGAGYMIMARTALGALLEPGREAVGPERAHAIAAIENKYLDFGVFDRAGRCVLALDVSANATPAVGNKALERAIVQNALGQAGLKMVLLTSEDSPADVRTKISPFLRPTSQGQAAPQSATGAPRSAVKARPGRPTRPMRPAHAAAIAAE